MEPMHIYYNSDTLFYYKLITNLCKYKSRQKVIAKEKYIFPFAGQ